jgi:hypothetical protein
MEAAAREVAELARQAALAGNEPGGVLRLGADELLVRLQRYLDDLLQVMRPLGVVCVFGGGGGLGRVCNLRCWCAAGRGVGGEGSGSSCRTVWASCWSRCFGGRGLFGMSCWWAAALPGRPAAGEEVA